MLTHTLVVGEMVSFKAKSDFPNSTIRYGKFKAFIKRSQQFVNNEIYQTLLIIFTKNLNQQQIVTPLTVFIPSQRRPLRFMSMLSRKTPRMVL